MQDQKLVKKMEILAPAGNAEVFEAAVASGADAVYFGLDELNARRGAENIPAARLGELVAMAHEKNCKAYLALNIDISERELGLAARYLEFARIKSVDAVIVKDPAFFKLISYFPQIRFHLSTQAAISSSAGVRAAKEFGFSRVVLPRELAEEEIRAASSVEGIETEIFAQGALCFCVSGRCLLSSWLGGRSGNRGLCASPCRFLWQHGNSSSRLFSAQDVSLAGRIKEIEACGVRALKIEGRMKNREWVAKTVKLFKRALDAPEAGFEEHELAELSGYAGRKSSSSFFDGIRTDIVGDFGRIKSDLQSDTPGEFPHEPRKELEVHAQVANGILLLRLNCENRKKEFAVKIAGGGKKFKTAADLINEIKSKAPDDLRIANLNIEPGIEISGNAFRDICREIASFMHQIHKKADSYLKIPLPEQIRKAIENAKGNCPQNCKSLSAAPDCVRIASFKNFCEFRKRHPDLEIIFDNAELSDIEQILASGMKKPTISLPMIFYEHDLGKLAELIEACSKNGFNIEVNSWDGWFLASNAVARMSGGPGLMVLNSLAALFLHEKKCISVFASIEADMQKLSDLCSSSKVPVALYAYGRPVLMISRARLDVEVPETGLKIKEKKGAEFIVKYEGDMLVLRPGKPFKVSPQTVENLRVSQFHADLVAEDEALHKFEALSKETSFQNADSFNLCRSLA